METINDACQSLEPCLHMQSGLGASAHLKSSHLVGCAHHTGYAAWQLISKSFKAGMVILLAFVK